jgi:hypothetical protein
MGLLDELMQNTFGSEPFDPRKHQQADVGLGGQSTEYLGTAQDADGAWFNYPTIWWKQDGTPETLSDRDAQERAKAYESATGKRFPRYPNSGSAEFNAMNRSLMGGANQGPLAGR